LEKQNRAGLKIWLVQIMVFYNAKFIPFAHQI